MVKELIHLRQKRLKNNNISLYLDCYYRGQRKYEYLNLYLSTTNTPQNRLRNKEIWNIALAIKSKRLIEFYNNNYEFHTLKDYVKVSDYIQMFIQKHHNIGTISTYVAFRHLLKNYIGKTNWEKITFKHITEKFCEGFYDYLQQQRQLAQNTKALYWSKFKTIINSAIKSDIIKNNPAKNIKRFTLLETKRDYLTIDEIKRLASCYHKEKLSKITIKRAFLFSCLTGLRISDIKNLKWSDITDDEKNGLTTLVFREQKNQKIVHIYLNRQARELMGEQKNRQQKNIFILPSQHTITSTLSNWMSSVGINKHITFHSARHTFATMLLTLDVDIYTISKLLGHNSIKTTQIYAKMVDKKKIEAVEKIPNNLIGEIWK